MLNPDLVQKNVKELLNKRDEWSRGKLYQGCSLEEFRVHMETEHEYLSKNAMTLFKMCIEGNLDMSKLTQMLALIRQVQNGSQQKETADKIVGKKLADLYVQPLVDKLEKEKK